MDWYTIVLFSLGYLLGLVVLLATDRQVPPGGEVH